MHHGLLAMPVFKWTMRTKRAKLFGKEPRAYGVQTMRYDVDADSDIRGLA